MKMLKIEIVLLTNNTIIPFQNLQRDYNLDFIELNKLFATASLAEHGLGFLINLYEGDNTPNLSKLQLKKQLIFDTGGMNQTFLHNLDIRGYTIYDTDTIILSHWHYDHTGGLYKILERIDTPVSIVCHEDALCERFFNRSKDLNSNDLINKNRSEVIPLLNSSKIVNQESIDLDRSKKIGGNILMSKTLEKVFEINSFKIMVSGEIPRIHEEETFMNFLINRNNILRVDDILDDKCLIIELKDSIVLLNGCCHSGIMNTLDYVKNITNKPISHIIGGFHMANCSEKRKKSTLDYLCNCQNEDLLLFPIHCSGDRFITDINDMKNPTIRAFNVSVGSVFNFFYI